MSKKDGVRKLLEEIAKIQKELTQSQKETDRELKELKKRMDETDKMMKETDRRMKETDRRMGRWINGWGSFIEGIAAPSIPKIFRKFEINVVGTYLDATRHKDGKTMEIDIICVGEKGTGKRVVIVVEMKSRLRRVDVSEFTEKLNNFLQFFDEYKGHEIIGVAGGMRVDKGVPDYAEKLGLCVIAPSGDVMTLLNRDDFKPKIWG